MEGAGAPEGSDRGGSRLLGLARLASRLAGASSGREMIDAVVAEAPGAVGMDLAAVRFVRGPELVSDRIRWPVEGDAEPPDDAVPVDAHLPASEAARSGTTVLVVDLLEYQAEYPELRAAVEASGLRSGAAVPFRDAKGELLGVLSLSSYAPSTFDPATVAAIAVAGELCGNALRRTQLGERAGALAELASRLAGAATTVDVAEAVRDLGREPLGAVHVNCRVLDSSGRVLVPLVADALPGGVEARYERVPLDAPFPLSTAVRTGEPVWIADPQELAARFPDVVSDAAEAGFGAMAAVPLHDSRGRILGVLALAWTNPVRFDPLLCSSIKTIADLGAQAIERANRYDSEHELVTALQHRLLGTVEPPDTVDVATRYVPAAEAVGIGGDWFDLVPTGPTSCTLVIGDVTGHGVEAVAAMAQLRAIVKGLLRAGEPLESLFDRVDAMRDTDLRLLASMAVYAVDTAASKLRYSSAGHPWALLRRASGDVELLDRAQSALLGAALGTRRPAELDVHAGDVLVAYTDGLVERRGESITVGIQRLVARLASSPADDADAIAEALLDATADARTTTIGDDVALVVLRVLDPHGATG